MIDIENLRKSFGDVEVLKGINLTIKEKEVVVIIGPSGSGKSTLLRCMNYLEEPTSGEVSVDGIVPDQGPPRREAGGRGHGAQAARTRRPGRQG